MKQFNKLFLELQYPVQTEIYKLANNPRPSGVGKLKNGENRYRIRVGVYCILYDICDDVLLITVVRIGHRREVYREDQKSNTNLKKECDK